MKTLLCSIVFLSLSLPAFAANHFVCYKRTDRTSHETQISALLVPIGGDLDTGAVLSYMDGRTSRYAEFKETKTEPRTGVEWTHLNQTSPYMPGTLTTTISIHSSGLKRSMYVVTMNASTLVSSESYFCEEESSI